MGHIYNTKLRFKRKKHPNFFVRAFSLLSYPKAKIGFIFNYRSFLQAYAMDESLDNTDENKVTDIVYGAAIEWCRQKKKRIFFDIEDIKTALMKASLKTNEELGKAMSHAQMPDWLEDIVENLPQDKQEGIKKKQP